MAVPVSWQKGRMPFAAVSALRRNCRATYLSFSEASGSSRILATWRLCSRRSINSTSWKACWATIVSASLLTFRMVLPSNSAVLTPSFESRRYSVVSLPSWNIGAYLNSGTCAMMYVCFLSGRTGRPGRIFKLLRMSLGYFPHSEGLLRHWWSSSTCCSLM